MSSNGKTVLSKRMTRKTDDTPYGIAITAVGGGVGQSVLRALRISSLPLQTIGLDVSPWSSGLYACNKGYVVPHCTDESYSDRLLEILTKESIQILIPGSDPEVSVISRMRDRFISKNIIPIVGSAEAVHLCCDKLSSYHFFKKNGIPFARTVATGDAFHLVREVGFPLISKPVSGSASRGITMIFNEEQLKRELEKGENIVQEYLVPKRWDIKPRELTPQNVYDGEVLHQVDEISIQILFDQDGNLLGRFTSCNVLRDGVPMLIDPLSAPAAEEIALEMALLLRGRGLSGPCNLQCKNTERGPVFFEVNPRFTGITAVRAAMGFNEVEAVLRRALLKESVESVRTRLQVPEDLVCSRYITEMVIPRAELDTIQRHGHVEGHGYRTTM